MPNKVYVINKHGRPLMPCSPAKARHLLDAGKAKVKKRTPFTIQLDGKGRPLLHFGFPGIQQMTGFCRGAGHQRTPVLVDDIHFVWHDAFLLLLL